VLIISNFPTLIGDPASATIVALLVGAAFIAGTVIALLMRSKRPDAYRNLIQDLHRDTA
jgi:hypothetical protein